MSIDVKCPKCGAELEAPAAAAGKKVQCPDCGERIPVAAAAEDAIQETAAPPKRGPVREGRRRDREDDEEEEDRPRRRHRQSERTRRLREEEEAYADDGVSTLIPYKNGRALAAYYCGVFSIIPVFGLILGPLALVFGVLGLRVVRRHPTAKGTAHAWVGIVLGTLTTLANWGGLIAAIIGGIIAGRSGMV